MTENNPSLIIKEDHNINDRFDSIKLNLNKIGIDLNDYNINLDINRVDGTISYKIVLNNIHFQNNILDH